MYSYLKYFFYQVFSLLLYGKIRNYLLVSNL